MKVGIISAMPSEMAYVFEHIKIKETIKKKMNQFTIGSYQGIDIVCVVCGVGKVNAAVYTQLLIDDQSPDYIINIGIAGGLGEGVKTLDLVVGNSYSHHDVNVKQAESLFPNKRAFPASDVLLKLIKEKIPTIHEGVMTSSESFIANNEEKQQIKQQFNPISVDMETSAIAHCCYLNEVPFISLRCISDLADDQADDSYDNFEIVASDLVGEHLLKILEELKK
ncbi:5'-methylthioadenosine/adenosylhomocysteine nucleosidase [Vagococcus hydrophili]|uniref:adenosylhomocysteine nucleosidase n=1 Tax=Vagococcus hydrophili TaxID=2714947 RepID=A0A6G8AVW7_9ENTE|nr:5'-methylthioadenosine/adenosylhomocysteine nucleosidase [Vagococcus hydrophili]QIL49102.1 5'-methylthioadenosine/adenosylhomocysteine nucleosidase [Vagococcus hydrophili]